ncbi:MAG: hypothetical protein ABI744_02700 [Chloroflexota bacterium]
MPQPAQVLRRALLVWGWGHAALGDRRGWLLAIIQFLAIGDWLIIAVQLIDGTRWLAVFVPLVLIIVFWFGQAVHAYRRAVRLGGAPGGELQLALFLPLVLAVFTAFWIIGGRHGSAASTVEAYMEAWQAGRPDVAAALYGNAPVAPQAIADLWQGERNQLVNHLTSGLANYGNESGLDPARPFGSLRVRQVSPTRFSVELVRSERFETTLLGIVPTAGLRTVVVTPVMVILVNEERVSDGLLPSSAWRIDTILVSNGS